MTTKRSFNRPTAVIETVTETDPYFAMSPMQWIEYVGGHPTLYQSQYGPRYEVEYKKFGVYNSFEQALDELLLKATSKSAPRIVGGAWEYRLVWEGERLANGILLPTTLILYTDEVAENISRTYDLGDTF